MSIGTLVYAQPDEVEATQVRGRRHFIKANRWEVISDSDGLLKGTWLPSLDAKQMLRVGDFYDEKTIIQILPVGLFVQVRGKKIFDRETNVEVEP